MACIFASQFNLNCKSVHTDKQCNININYNKQNIHCTIINIVYIYNKHTYLHICYAVGTT